MTARIVSFNIRASLLDLLMYPSGAYLPGAEALSDGILDLILGFQAVFALHLLVEVIGSEAQERPFEHDQSLACSAWDTI